MKSGTIARCLLVGLGFLFLALGWWLLRRLRRLRDLPVAAGTVIRHQVVRAATLVESDDGVEEYTVFRPVVEYDYVVGGEHYRGSRLGMAEVACGSPQGADRLLIQYPEQSAVEVRYDPAVPWRGFLEYRNLIPWVMLAMGMALLTVSALLCIIVF